MKGTLRRSWALVVVVAVAAGCRTNIRVEPPGSNPAGNQNDNSTPRESGIAEMRRFASEQEFQQYFTGQVTLENQQPERMPGAGLPDNPTANPGSNLGEGAADGTAGGLAGAPVPGTAPGAEPPRNDGGFSGTTIQEAGVDEADVVKTDGTYLYLISDGKLRIVQAVPADELKQVGEFELNGYGQDMYLFDDRVVTVTAPDFPIYALGGGGVVMGAPGAAAEGDAGGGVPEQTAPPSSSDPTMVDPGLPVGGGDTGFLPPIYYRPQVEVTVIDVSDKTAPALVTSTKFDGSLGASRMIDGVLHLVVANYPVFWADVLPLGRPEAVAMASSMDTATVLPNYEMTKPDGSRESGDAVSWENLFHPVDPDGFGMSLLISLDVRQPDHFNSLGIVADPGLIYSSLDALYVTDTQYSFFVGSDRETTKVYKFNYNGASAELAAAGTVDGRILNQYSMSEYQGNLRVATTVEAFDRSTPTISNHVFVLGEADGRLNVLGRIDDISNGERIYSARFIDDKGYLVTFRQVDPLHTLDLSDPRNPRLVGELQVPGFSTFIVPVSDTRLLTIGQSVSNQAGFVEPDGVKLSIFDVSDFAHPREVSNTIISAGENSYSYSEAVYNPKAFNFYHSPTHGDLLALPVQTQSFGQMTRPGEGGAIVVDSSTEFFSGVYVYQVTDSGLAELGRISMLSPADQQDPYLGFYSFASYGRGVFIGDEVYSVSDRAVVAAALADVGTSLSRVDFPLPFDIPPFPIDGGGVVVGGGEAGSGSVTPDVPPAP